MHVFESRCAQKIAKYNHIKINCVLPCLVWFVVPGRENKKYIYNRENRLNTTTTTLFLL